MEDNYSNEKQYDSGSGTSAEARAQLRVYSSHPCEPDRQHCLWLAHFHTCSRCDAYAPADLYANCARGNIHGRAFANHDPADGGCSFTNPSSSVYHAGSSDR